ncbi:MAG: hypothetical protein PHY48_17480, partial [Candidatus Cloacimonetes bacterium]|nr:hypothetical protein [Candidatus Cloacimonadota bacterium]
PLMHFMPMVKPYCLWVQGLTGSFKTSYVSLLQCFFGDFRTGNFETWRSTANSIEKNGCCLKDVSYVLDDYKKADISDKAVVTLLHNYSDRHGRSRMRADMSNQKTWHIRGLLTSTGEDQPNGEASVIARLLLLLIKNPGNSERLTRGQMHAKLLPGVMAKYIQYLANRNFKEDEVTLIIREKEKLFTTGHARIKEVLAVNSFAWDIFADFLGCEDLSVHYYAALQELKNTMDRTTKAEQAGTMFTDTIRDLLESGAFHLDGLKGANGTPHAEHSKRLGWITDDCAYVLGSVALAEANALRQRLTGQPIRYSAQAIYDQLIASGHMITQAGKPSHVIKVEGASIRVLKFARGVVEDLDQTYNDPQPEGSEVRFEENGALLN